jgi:putative ABC transport system permease protein
MPDWAREVRTRLAPLHLSSTRESEVVDELSQHLDDRWRELIASGASPDEATKLTLAGFRGKDALAQHMASLRQAHSLPSITPGAPAGHLYADLWDDIRYSARTLRKQPGFAATALITIAIGVGGTAAVFSVVYGVLLRPLPYLEPERLVQVSEVHPGGRAPIPGPELSGPTYRAWSQSAPSLEGIAAFRVADYTVTTADVAQRLRGTRVTPSLFRLLRASPFAGRFFSNADADDGAPPVVVLAHGLWRERFGEDSTVVGRQLSIDGIDHQIIGVAPPGFAFPEKEVGLRDDRREITMYTPLALRPSPGARVVDYSRAIARLKPGVTIAQAEKEGTSYARSVDRPLADLVFGKGNPVEVRVRSLVDQMTMRVRPALVVLAAGVTLVLLIACANVANLLLSRGSDRGRELAIRSALGADRTRLVRQLLTESLVVALLGGILGIFVGWMLIWGVPVFAPADFPRLDEIQVDARFLIVALSAAVFVGVISGIAPALRGSRVALATLMQVGGPRSTGTSGGYVRRVLLAAEAALAVVLLVGAALLARSFAELVRVDAGYDPANVLTADVRLPDAAGTEARRSMLAVSMVERLRSLPGVRSAGAGDMAPFGSMLSSFGFTLPGMTTAEGRPVAVTALRAIVTPGYAEALGMRLKEGRFFDAEDTGSAIRSILVNEAFAKTYFGDGRPVAGRLFPGMFPNWLGKTTMVQVVGVVEDMLPAALDARPQPQIFVAQGATVHIGRATLVVRVDGDPAAIASQLRGIVQQTEPGATIERAGPLAAKISASVGEPRFATFVLVAFAVLALVLATTGLYGVLSYNIAQRRREIAVHAALGAAPRDLVKMVMREGLTTTVIGLAAGVVLATIATRAMASALFGVTPLDIVSFVTGPLLLLMVACVACVVPARRAVGIDPVEALKTD